MKQSKQRRIIAEPDHPPNFLVMTIFEAPSVFAQAEAAASRAKQLIEAGWDVDVEFCIPNPAGVQRHRSIMEQEIRRQLHRTVHLEHVSDRITRYWL
jgi:hypothetical protein